MVTPEQIKKKVQTIIQLPPLPSISMQVVELADNPKTSAAQLGKVISTDQALTAKVLKIANSPFYGYPRKISTIDFAIIILGFDALKEIVISISLMNALQKKDDKYFDAKAFWDHSIATGVIARRLARDLGYRVSGEVFVAGLLHDMGISVLHRYFSNEFKRIVEVVRDSELTFLESEESILGATHAQVGGWLAERWNLPDHLIEALSFHHTPAQATQNPKLVAILHCADVLANRLSGQHAEFDKGIELDPAAAQMLGVSDMTILDQYVEEFSSLLREQVDQAVAFAAF
jgi:HD-like signal output (HDOD) protein